MNPEELFRGESETIEYKASVAPKSEAYMKTVIAFANGRGGQLLFGVQDISGEALGLGRKTVFKYMDAVANAIASKCEPRIHPHIYLYEIDRKPIIIVDVPAGAETPYRIQGEGIENGTYVRVGATTRKADRYRIEELILRGQHKFFDQELTDVTVKEKDAQAFCDGVYEYMKDNAEPGKKIRKLGIGQLLSWGLLHEADHHFYASNGYLLLDGADQKVDDTGIQCAVYEGNRRGTILVREEYNGVFYHNIDKALQFILSHLEDKNAQGEEFGRSQLRQMPADAIREILVNAVCHRSYQTPGKIQVGVFDDKIEIVSPGGLDCSLAVEDIIAGRSRVRNPAIANALRYAGMFEGWGNGIPHLVELAEENGLPSPVFRARPGDFLIRLSAVQSDQPADSDEAAEAVPVPEPVEIPTFALLEPSSATIGAHSAHDEYQFIPYDSISDSELVLPELPETELQPVTFPAAGEENDKRNERTPGGQGRGHEPRPKSKRRGGSGKGAWKRDARQEQKKSDPRQGGAGQNGRTAQENGKRPGSPETAEERSKKPKPREEELTEVQRIILNALRKDPELTQNGLRDTTSLSLATVRRTISSLEEMNWLARSGGRRYGKWIVMD